MAGAATMGLVTVAQETRNIDKRQIQIVFLSMVVGFRINMRFNDSGFSIENNDNSILCYLVRAVKGGVSLANRYKRHVAGERF